MIFLYLFGVHAVECENLGVTQSVDTRERKQFVDAGERGFFVFDLRQPWARYQKFFISFGIGNGFTENSNFTRGDPKSGTNLLEACSRVHGFLLAHRRR